MTGYANDAPSITDETDVEELVDYARYRVQNPIRIDRTTIYNFNSHKLDMEALRGSVNNKLQREVYQIPLQVRSGNILMQAILPEEIRQSEILVYREDKKEYYAYKNLIRDLPLESREKIKQEFAEIMREQ